MKGKAIETHDLRQRRFAMPGTDLGETNAIPFNEAYDVDQSGGRQSQYALGNGDSCSQFSRLVQDSEKELKPATNPTRAKMPEPEWMKNECCAPSVPMKRRRK